MWQISRVPTPSLQRLLEFESRDRQAKRQFLKTLCATCWVVNSAKTLHCNALQRTATHYRVAKQTLMLGDVRGSGLTMNASSHYGRFMSHYERVMSHVFIICGKTCWVLARRRFLASRKEESPFGMPIPPGDSPVFGVGFSENRTFS